MRRRLLAALALEAVGIGSKAIELAIEYVKEREQFGKKIGTYQAISHSLVDGYVAVELARSLAYWAAWAVAEDDAQADLAVAAAKSQAAEAAVLACEKSIQAHGGIGFTWEHPLHRYYKRALWLEGALGYGREQRAEIAASLSVLVTGASTGIGAATALSAARPRLDGATRRCAARGEAPDGTTELVFDVTDGDAVAARGRGAVERLDALVDNAGIAIAAPLEFLPPDELTRQLDVNVVGQLRVLQAFLPALRAARGRVVLMGSVAGRSALPFLGAYAMSKFALEAMADALRVELAPWGIHVAIVEPGTIATPIWTKPQRRGRGAPARGGRALRRARRRSSGALAAERSAARGPGRDGRGRRRARAHGGEAEDALPRRPRREAPRPVAAPPRPAARPGPDALPVRLVSDLHRSATSGVRRREDEWRSATRA